MSPAYLKKRFRLGFSLGVLGAHVEHIDEFPERLKGFLAGLQVSDRRS